MLKKEENCEKMSPPSKIMEKVKQTIQYRTNNLELSWTEIAARTQL